MAWAAVTSQHAHNIESGAATLTVTLPANGTVGNSLVLCVESGNSFGAATTSVSGGGVTTWTEEVFDTYNDSGFFSRLSHYYGVITSGATVITITVNNSSSGSFAAASVQEYSGLLAGGASDMDVGQATHGTSGGTATVTTAATSAANELVTGGYTDDGSNVTPTSKNGAGFTERDSTGASSTAESYLEDKDSGSSGSAQTANMSASIGGFWGMTCAVFKIAAGGGGGGTTCAPTHMLFGMGC